MPDRENVIKTLEKIKAQTKEIGLDKAVLAHKFMDEIMKLLKEQEVVVRCKDCKYCGSEIRDGIKFAKCELKHNWMPQDEWFCADGERRAYKGPEKTGA